MEELTRTNGLFVRQRAGSELDLNYEETIALLKAEASSSVAKGMKRFGIETRNALGLSVPFLRGVARRTGKDHELALKLWGSGIHEARILAAMVDDPKLVTERQMEDWVQDFDSWDVCDGCCSSLFDKTPFAYAKALEWSQRGKEFVRRAGFAMMASLAVHDKKARDEEFLHFLPAIREGSTDERNFVKKAVNWALRQIGKRNQRLNREAITAARQIQHAGSRSAKWIASDALRELTSESVSRRLAKPSS